jgi:hypothetical protein
VTKTKAQKTEVHRALKPGMHGPDVKALQEKCGEVLKHAKLEWLAPAADGEVGIETIHTTHQALFVLGADEKNLKAVKKGRIGLDAQKIVRTKKRNATRAKQRSAALKDWRQAYKDRHPDVPAPVHASIALADRMVAKHQPYKWGGCHITPPCDGPGDCSWYASMLSQVLDDSIPTGTTFSLAADTAHFAQGEGEYLTLYIKNSPANDAHVICKFSGKCFPDGKERWTECGGRDNTGAGGPCWFNPTASRINEFPIHIHVKGF